MSLVKWNPWREMEDMFGRYDRAVGWPRSGSQEIMTAGDWCPRVDIVENDNEFVIKAEIPEVKKEDVKVSVDNGVLTLKGERQQEKEEKGKSSIELKDILGPLPAASPFQKTWMSPKSRLPSRTEC
jgi:heat shock protein Hsp20